MPRPKRIPVLTTAPAKSSKAIKEYQAGIENFITWANRARTGDTSEPAALQADAALTAFSKRTFDGAFSDLSVWAVLAGKNILRHVRDGHWHLTVCPHCNRWLLAKDQRRTLCRRVECVRLPRKKNRARERAAIKALDMGKMI